MYILISILISIALAAGLPRLLPATMRARNIAATGIRVVFSFIILALLLSTSFISISADKIGVVRKLYGYSNLTDGHLIATNGENGYQASTIASGTWKFSPFFNVFNTIKEEPLVVIPNGFYGRIVARDGLDLPNGQVMADAWPDDQFADFLNAEYFLKHGGQKGLQLSVLKPGTYALNLALFTVRVGYAKNGRDIVKGSDDIYDINGKEVEDSPLSTEITRVPAGSVAVIRSSVQEKGKDCTPVSTKITGNGTADAASAPKDVDGLVAELVPVGCKGIWKTSLPPNDYYLNRDAFDVTLVSTRVTTLEFKGGYTRRFIDLKVDSKGDFQQAERQEVVPVSGEDAAINAKIEGWSLPQEVRAITQISPEHAPIVVAAVGGQEQIDKSIIIPSIRSHLRNVFGSSLTVNEIGPDGTSHQVTRPTHVLDTIDHRPELEDAILARIKIDGQRAGVDIKEVRLGEASLPPELLLARQREQLATQLKAAFAQEQIAQTQRQQTEQARATANRQDELVAAQIGVQTAALMQQKRQAEGHGERLFLEEQAAGQSAQANVLGKDKVITLQIVNSLIDLLKAKPEILSSIKLPSTYVSSGGGLDAAAAIFGGAVAAAEKAPAPKP